MGETGEDAGLAVAMFAFKAFETADLEDLVIGAHDNEQRTLDRLEGFVRRVRTDGAGWVGRSRSIGANRAGPGLISS